MSQHDTLTQALQQIADWNSHTTEYAVDYGSNGVRDFYRNIARAALSATQPAQTEQPVLPVHETTEMHDAVMSVLYKGVGRTETDKLWQAYRSAMITAYPAAPAQAAQPEPVKPLFASKVAARKWSELQEAGARMQSIAFDGHKSGQPGTIDPWGVVRWGQAAQGAGEVVYQIKGDVFQCPHAWRDTDEETFHMVTAKDRRIVYTTPSQPAPVVPESVADQLLLVGQAIRKIQQHSVMPLKLLCADTFSEFVKLRAMLAATPTPPAQAAADARDAILFESSRWGGADCRLAVWESLRILGSRMGVTVTKEDQYTALATHQQGGK